MSHNEPTLVTGAGGFLGQNLLRSLARSGVNAIPWTRATGDLRDTDRVREAIKAIKPRVVYHLASQPAIASENSWAIIGDEQLMLSNLAYAIPSHCQLIYTGSMAEIGRSGIFSEDEQCTPDTAYGCAKFAGTNLALSLRAGLGLDIKVARLFGVYGGGEAAHRLLPSLIARLSRGEAVPLSDGLQIRDFVHVEDVCAILQKFASFSDGSLSLLNIGTGVGITVRDVCLAVAEMVGANTELLQFGEVKRRHVDQDCLVANVDRLSKITTPPAQRWLFPEKVSACIAEFQAQPPS